MPSSKKKFAPDEIEGWSVADVITWLTSVGDLPEVM